MINIKDFDPTLIKTDKKSSFASTEKNKNVLGKYTNL